MPDAKSRTVSLFRNGRSQAIRIPKEFEFDAEQAIITLNPYDQSLTLSPVKPQTIGELLDEWSAEHHSEEALTLPEIIELPMEEIDPFSEKKDS